MGETHSLARASGSYHDDWGRSGAAPPSRRRPLPTPRPHHVESTGSIAAGVDDLAAGLGPDGTPGKDADAVLDELDRAVAEDHVHATGVERRGRDLAVVGIQVAGRVVIAATRLLVR